MTAEDWQARRETFRVPPELQAQLDRIEALVRDETGYEDLVMRLTKAQEGLRLAIDFVSRVETYAHVNRYVADPPGPLETEAGELQKLLQAVLDERTE